MNSFLSISHAFEFHRSKTFNSRTTGAKFDAFMLSAVCIAHKANPSKFEAGTIASLEITFTLLMTSLVFRGHDISSETLSFQIRFYSKDRI